MCLPAVRCLLRAVRCLLEGPERAMVGLDAWGVGDQWGVKEGPCMGLLGAFQGILKIC